MPMPEPSRSQIASCARRRTSSGRTAGPDEKFSLRIESSAPGQLFEVEHRDRDAVERLVRRLRDHEVGHFLFRMTVDPGGDLFTELIAVSNHRGGEHLHA